MKRPAVALILAMIGLILAPGAAWADNAHLSPTPPVLLPSAPGKGRPAPATPAAHRTSPLPKTGFGLALPGLIGVAMLSAGTVLRRPRHLLRR